MEKLSYKEARNLIIDAYFKDEIKPFNPSFCFCGTLAPDSNWVTLGENYMGRPILKVKEYPYSIEEYRRMEKPLMNALCLATVGRLWELGPGFEPWHMKCHPEWENGIFTGMCDSLDVLKQIHIERGENVDEGDEIFYQRTVNDKRNAYTTVEG